MPQHPLRDDPARAGARAHFRAMGIDPDRLDGPIVGIASTWTGTMPCNLTQRELADQVAEAVTAAGGVPLIFNTIAVSDNQTQATSGMRASLVSREVIADSIELMAIAHQFDALVCLTGCDKTTPAALMALARIDRPAVVLYSGPMRAGRLRERALTIGDVWEAVGAPRPRADGAGGAGRDRAACVSRAGHLRRPVHGQHDGDRARLPRPRDPRRRADPRRRPRGEGAARPPARASSQCSSVRTGGPTARDLPDADGDRQRDGRRGGDGRIDERPAAPAGDRPRGRAWRSRLDELTEIAARTPVWPAWRRPASTWRRTSTGSAARRPCSRARAGRLCGRLGAGSRGRHARLRDGRRVRSRTTTSPIRTTRRTSRRACSSRCTATWRRRAA